MAKPVWIGLGLLIGLCAFGGYMCTHQVEHGLVSFDVSPDGKFVAFSSAEGDLWLLNLESGDLTNLVRTNAIESEPAFAPDGKRIAYCFRPNSGSAQAIRLLDLKDLTSSEITSEGRVWNSAPSFGRDGTSIVFVRAARHRPYSLGGWTWDDYDVFRKDLTTGKEVQLSRKKYYQAESPLFIEDEVYFCADGGDRHELYSVAYKVLDGGEPKELMPVPAGTQGIGAWASDLSFSAVSRNFCFISDRTDPFAYDIWFLDRRSGLLDALEVTEVARYNSMPRFLPNGESVLYLAGTRSNMGSRPIFSLYLASKSARPVRVADSKLFTNPDSWSKEDLLVKFSPK